MSEEVIYQESTFHLKWVNVAATRPLPGAISSTDMAASGPGCCAEWIGNEGVVI